VEPVVYTDWRAAKAAIDLGQVVLFAAVGNSMEPRIKSRQPVTLKPVDPTRLRKDDAVLVKVNGRVYLHLVKALRRGQVQIGNNHGHINGWTVLGNVYAIVDGRM
jgi:phage repressor protein C with HTH and peptisase S24 domain